MIKECPFNPNNNCAFWTEFQIAHVALQDAEKLNSFNWNEINYLLNRVMLLESLLIEPEIKIPE